MTAYGPRLADPTAVVGARIGAYVIDLLLVAAAAIACLVPIFLNTSIEAPSGSVTCNSGARSEFGVNRDRSTTDPSMCFDNGTTVRYIPFEDENAFTVKLYAIFFGIQAANLVLLQGLTGASLGKLIFGLRVVRPNGRTAGLGWALARWLMLQIDTMCCFLPGAVLVFTTKGHRRLGDMVATTFVIRKGEVGRPPMVPGVNAPGPDDGYLAYGSYGPYNSPSYPAPGGGSAWPGASTPAEGSPWTPGTPTSPTPSGDGPTWDPARDAYIQYDRERAEWLQWDDTTKQWRPISR